MESRLKLKVEQFDDAFVNFKDSISIELKNYSGIVLDSIKSGQVQKFEICAELLWKAFKAYLWEINGIDSNSPKMVFKEIYNLGYLLVHDYEEMLGIIDDRNRLSHVYNEAQYLEIYNRIVKTVPLFTIAMNILKTPAGQV